MGNLPEGAEEVQGALEGTFIKFGKEGDSVTGIYADSVVRPDKFNPGREQTIYVIRSVEQCISHKQKQNEKTGAWEPSDETIEVKKGDTALVTGKGTLRTKMGALTPGDRIHIEFLGMELVMNRKTGARIPQGQYKVYKLPAIAMLSESPF